MRLFLLLASLAIVGCQQVPVTGRSQFILVDEGEVASLSAAEFAKMKKLPADPRLPKLREIGLKIVAAARRDDKAGVLPPASRWEFAIIDDKSPNAFAMPGGKIGFHTGMFAFAPTDDDLAVIMGHEVAHVICRHGSERISQTLGVAIVAAVADEATRDSSAKTRGTWMAAVGIGAQYGILLPFSRSHASASSSWPAPATIRKPPRLSGPASARPAAASRRSSSRPILRTAPASPSFGNGCPRPRRRCLRSPERGQRGATNGQVR